MLTFSSRLQRKRGASGHEESGLVIYRPRGGIEPSLGLFTQKSRREKTLLISPCTLIRPVPAPARRLRVRTQML